MTFHSNIFVAMTLVVLMGSSVSAEYFSSITGLENVLYTERMLLRSMRSYIHMSRQHLAVIESDLQRIELEHELASNDGAENYLTNPVNVFRLMKRLSKDWSVYETRILQNHAGAYFTERATLIREMLSMPHQEDVDGSATALVRLQEAYRLEVPDIAAGVLNGIKYGTDMNWHDCYIMAQLLYELGFYNQTKPWLRHSIDLLNQNSFASESYSLNFMEAAAERSLELGDLDWARKLSEHILKLGSNRAKAKEVLKKLDEWQMESFEVTDSSAFGEDTYHTSKEYDLYLKVCRGEIKPTPAQCRPLRCRYATNNQFIRILAPFKLEEHSLDPLVFTIHDVIADHKIETLKQMAIPRMQRSTVATNHVNGSATSHVRISKQAWLPYHLHQYMLDMQRKIHDATGLDMTYAEELQIANYGLGGHYEPHWDFYINVPDYMGNRIATAIFYFSDVEQGGSTAFPFLGISVKPKKGSMLFWFNLHRSGDLDYRTKHAACPVLKGSKWIANVWIRELTQTFVRPCLVKRDHEISLKLKTVE